MSKQYYFLSGIGGSGMLPLALILKNMGYRVSGSDRAYDQGMFAEKFTYLKNQGIELCPQDGRGLTPEIDKLVISAAVESDTPDVLAAKSHNIPIEKRADVLAGLFNGFKHRIAIGGTSGKTTVTGMIGFILEQAGKDPIMMNGGNLVNYYTPDTPYPSVLLGQSDVFITEADESDGTIALYDPSIAVLNNLALDHKKPEETAVLFKDFIAKARHAVINADAFSAEWLDGDNVISYGIKTKAQIQAELFENGSVVVKDRKSNEEAVLNLSIPGEHNISNALAAIASVSALGISISESCLILSHFKGIKRRLEIIGIQNDIMMIDDFAHNPDKISASMKTLKSMGRRLIVVFQPHGFGPLKLMGREIAEAFAQHMDEYDILCVPDVIYWGGTVNREVTSKDLVAWVKDLDRQAFWFEDRETMKAEILNVVKPNDVIVIMGARDDSLTTYAHDILKSLKDKVDRV